MSQVNLESLPLDADLVAEYLQQNPDFFNRYPQLLEQLRISHHEKGSVSLVELSLQRMREKISGLEDEITELMTIASHNERIFRVYVDLLPQLLRCQSFEQLCICLRRVLIKQLDVSQLVLWLNRSYLDMDNSLSDRSLSGEQIENLWVTRLSVDGHYFGRLTRGEQTLLFAQFEQANSVALMPLGERARLGLLVAASRSSDHYVAGMDSLLLSQLCKVIEALLPPLVSHHA